MRLALTDLFRARWTDQIHDEWTPNLLANRPELRAESLARCRQMMDEHVPDCLVTGYESLIPTLSLPDPDHRHVLAAAIHGGAGLIITYNLSDFPASAFGQFEIEAVRPDEFIIRNWDQSPDLVLGAARRQRAGLTRPPTSAPEYLATLEQCRLPKTASRFRQDWNEI